MSGWLTPADVARYGSAGVPAGDPVLVTTTEATQAWVERQGIVSPDVSGPEDVPADIRLGALMLAWRWFQRRSSPLGVAGYAEFGSSGMLRHDPDVAKLLGLGGESGAFTFGAGGRRASDQESLILNGTRSPALAPPPYRGWIVG